MPSAVDAIKAPEKGSKKKKSSTKSAKPISEPTQIAESEDVEMSPEISTKRSRKEGSSKKRKSSSAPHPSSTSPESTTATADLAAETPLIDSVLSILEAKKVKKDKSSKKRKAVALVDETAVDIVAAPEPSSSAAAPSSSDHKESNGSDDESQERPAKKRKASDVDEIEVDINAPEPPSKKALRALKKGKPLPPSKSGAESPEPEAKKKPEVEKRSEHGVWIGNMPWSVSKEDLRKFLVDYSDLTDEMITRIHMPSPDDGKPANQVGEKKFGKKVHNKGFAYVDFSSAEGAETAIELSEELLMGRRVLIKNHKSFEGRPAKTKEETRMEGKPPSKKVFMGNLSYDVTEESLTEHFEKCGSIESIKIAQFEDTGKCKGYAWVVFNELEAAQSAVKGFVMIEQALSDASESEDDSDAEVESGAEEVVNKSKPKKTKRIKWWVNKIKGRPLRMEFAEDAQVRYKKRYGAGGTKGAAAGGAAGEGGPASKEDAAVGRPVLPSKTVEYRKPYAARLTGGIVESKGAKTKF